MQFGCIQIPAQHYQYSQPYTYQSRSTNPHTNLVEFRQVPQDFSNHHMHQIQSAPGIKYLSEERKLVKQFKESGKQYEMNMEYHYESINPTNPSQDRHKTHSRKGTQPNLNDVIENLEVQWQSLKKQHGNFDQRSASSSPSKNYLINSLKQREPTLFAEAQPYPENLTLSNLSQSYKPESSKISSISKLQPKIIKKVVPLSKINLASMVQLTQIDRSIDSKGNDTNESKALRQPQPNLIDPKESDHFKQIVDKYSNVYRKRSPESFISYKQSCNTASPQIFRENQLHSAVGNGGTSPALQKQCIPKQMTIGLPRNQPKRETYNTNNLKSIDERVRGTSKEVSPYKNSSKDLKKSYHQVNKAEKHLEVEDSRGSFVPIKPTENDWSEVRSSQKQQTSLFAQVYPQHPSPLYQSQINYDRGIHEERFQPLQQNMPSRILEGQRFTNHAIPRLYSGGSTMNLNRRVQPCGTKLIMQRHQNIGRNITLWLENNMTQCNKSLKENGQQRTYSSKDLEDRQFKRPQTLHQQPVVNIRMMEQRRKK